MLRLIKTFKTEQHIQKPVVGNQGISSIPMKISSNSMLKENRKHRNGHQQKLFWLETT